MFRNRSSAVYNFPEVFDPKAAFDGPSELIGATRIDPAVPPALSKIKIVLRESSPHPCQASLNRSAFLRFSY